mmetsp:Transcript_26681/g.68521  ORF Transcript_26681/g.68521 Transcript_26681/m.68521 type:complete len:125 (-) Transcript_26681:3320-3694(-)
MNGTVVGICQEINEEVLCCFLQDFEGQRLDAILDSPATQFGHRFSHESLEGTLGEMQIPFPLLSKDLPKRVVPVSFFSSRTLASVLFVVLRPSSSLSLLLPLWTRGDIFFGNLLADATSNGGKQ